MKIFQNLYIVLNGYDIESLIDQLTRSCGEIGSVLLIVKKMQNILVKRLLHLNILKKVPCQMQG